MNANLWTQLLIAIVPALITGVGSLIIAINKCKNEINTLETNNKHEIEKLMKQHKIDIEALNALLDNVRYSSPTSIKN